MLQDVKVVLDDFHGLWYRGMEDTIPPGHFRVCTNAIFSPRQISRRPGTITSYPLGFLPRKVFLGTVGNPRLEETSRFFLILDSEGNIHRDNSQVIMTMSYGFDFSAINLYDRIYISPNNAGIATNPELLWVYKGTGEARLAGGEAPETGVTAEDGDPGVVSKGLHKLAVSFVTDTGFMTPPSPLAEYDAPGEKMVDVTDIPVGEGEVVSRRILCTKAGEEELFFVPGDGIIEDNVATSVELDFADTDLVVSADYLNDIYERIPAGTQLLFYRGRLVVVCGEHKVLISNVQDPETFSKVDGLLAIPSEDYQFNPPIAGWVLRDTLYISKFPGVYGAQDDGSEPNSWPVTVIDDSIGCYPNGIGSYTSAYPGRNISDFELILTQQGVFLFDGVFRRPPLTWKIEELWQQVVQGEHNNPLGANYYFWKMSLVHDVVTKKFYINCNTADIDPISNLQWIVLHGDYSLGWEADKIRWSTWAFQDAPWTVGMALHPIDNRYALRICPAETPELWTLNPTSVLDQGDKDYELHLETGLLDHRDAVGSVLFFLGVQLRAKGACALALGLTDGVSTYNLQDLVVDSSASRDFLRLANFTSEKARLVLRTGQPIDINRIEVKCKPMFLQRPQV